MPNRAIEQLICKQQILTATATMSVAEAATAMRSARVGAIMVLKGGRLAGIFTERDALYRVLAEGRDPTKTRLGEVMTADPTTASPQMPFGHALHLMYERGFRHVPVVDKGVPVGMVSARDALGPELDQFESELKEREHLMEVMG
ncbi:MAG: CBS domain-containing protein [Rhodocyclales bacterium]|nr:CBS domain-containing protein [Rhodocyclales bacterium]